MAALAQSGQGSKHTDEDRRYVINVYAVYGNAVKTGELCGIPARTVQDWVKTEWGMQYLAQVREAKSDEIDAGVSRNIQYAMDSVESRFKQGDHAGFHPDTGKARYKPVSAKDSAVVFGVMFDKRQIMRNLPTRITQGTDNEALKALKEQFERLANTKVIEGEVLSKDTD